MTNDQKRYYAITNLDSDPSMIAVVSTGNNMRKRFQTALQEHYDFEDVRINDWFDENEVMRKGTTQITITVFEDDHSFELDLTIEQTWLY